MCPADRLQCASGHCYLAEYHCDGDRDCSDMTDETNCPTRYPDGRYCPTNEFECANGVSEKRPKSIICILNHGSVVVETRYILLLLTSKLLR